jgi:predicted transposase/invertase (TIGR01784 family)
MSQKRKKSSDGATDNNNDVKKLHQIYDKLFKLVFEHEPSVTLFMRKFGSPAVVNELDFNSLQLDTNSYLTKQLEAYFSDMVWKAKWGKEEIAVAFLFEHKSAPERYVAVQLLGYICSILERDVKAKRPLTLVLPSVFHHGKRNWKPKTLVQLYDSTTVSLHPFIPNFEIPCFRVDAIDDQIILALPDDTVLKALLLILKHGKDENAIKQHFPHFFSFYEDNPHLHRFLEPFVLHMSELTELKTEIVQDLIENTLSPKTKDGVMTTYAQFIQKGMLQGKAEGIIENKIMTLCKAWRKGFNVELMADLTDLPETTIKSWVNRFEILKQCRLDKKSVTETAALMNLTASEVTNWETFFDKMETQNKIK